MKLTDVTTEPSTPQLTARLDQQVLPGRGDAETQQLLTELDNARVAAFAAASSADRARAADPDDHDAEVLSDRAVRRLAAIHVAYERIAEATYGECSDCGDRIPTARLLVMPASPWCVRCAEPVDGPVPSGAGARP